MAISLFYGGAEQTDVHGMKRRAHMQLVMAISLFYNGLMQTDVHVTKTLMTQQCVSQEIQN